MASTVSACRIFSRRLMLGRTCLHPFVKQHDIKKVTTRQNLNLKRFFKTSISSQQGANLGQKSNAEIITVQNAIKAVREQVTESTLPRNGAVLYLGIGQYSDIPEHERIFVLQSTLEPSGLYSHTVLLDSSLPSSDLDSLMEELEKMHPNFTHGEVNSVGKSRWNHAFTIKPDFKIFAENSLLCHLTADKLHISGKQLLEEVPLKDIESVIVHLSEEPWNEQGIDIKLKDDVFVSLVNFEILNDNRDLAMLMIDTEWSVKAAAILSLQLKKLGHQIELKLPSELTIQKNPWVQDRHKTWTRLVSSL